MIEARFIKRYKRFFADFELEDGRIVTAHCPNTGSMKTCMEAGAPSLLTFHDDPKRKLKYTWQAIRMPDGWVGINTNQANHLVAAALEAEILEFAEGYTHIQREKKVGEKSRIDFFLSGHAHRPDCWMEVKNVTLLLEDGIVGFPDAVTQRGTKHLNELAALHSESQRAILLFCVQRQSATRVVPAENFDPVYAETLRQVAQTGVEIYAYHADINPQTGVRLARALPVDL